ncbi:MAG: type III polyketide synthase [Balneolaceae bacterium]|nr:type III polyketide synthase [Balneolaceae bacterium]
MGVYLHKIATAVPDQSYEQSFLRDQMKKYISNERTTRSIIHQIYSKSGIEKRHSVIKDFHANGDPRLFFQDDGSFSTPSTGTRNELYSKHAKKLFVDIARKLLENQDDIQKSEITHVITVSCTGFFAPEPAYEIVKQLGLSASTQRFHLGFMGCFAAFPALKMAKSFCESDPHANVLVVCLELCSIHLQSSQKTDNLISASVFADGGAGALVSSKEPSYPHFSLNEFATSIADNSEKDMAWTIGDTGFDMVLSTYVPEIIESNLKNAVQPLVDTYSTNLKDIKHWALHPGGRAILDKVEDHFNLDSQQLASSRATLANYGNMSSATVLFVLKHLLEQPAQENKESTLAIAFGPGLTIESGLLTKISG